MLSRPSRSAASPAWGWGTATAAVGRPAYSWPLLTAPRASARSPLHGAGQPGDVVLHEEGVDERDGHRPQEGARHQRAPEEHVAADQLGHHADRHRLLLGRGEEDEGVDELVP